MISSKQRSLLRALANRLQPIFQIGKGGLTEPLLEAISEALDARELIKIRVLKNVDEDTRPVAEAIATATGATVVQVIGHNAILYRQNSEEPIIKLP